MESGDTPQHNPMARLGRIVLLGMVVGLLSAAAPRSEFPTLEELVQYEEALLTTEGRNLATLNPGDRFGADPFKILYLTDHDRYLILLSGRSEVILTDGSLKPIDRQVTPRSPTGWARGEDGHLFIGGDLSGEIGLYHITPGGLTPRATLRPRGVTSVRDLVYVPAHRSLYLLDPFERRLVRLTLAAEWQKRDSVEFSQQTFPIGAGPVQIRHVENHLLINLLLDHRLLILPLIDGRPAFGVSSSIDHDGPIWAFDALVRDKKLVIAAAGVEDRPLNRRGGEFGYIDSFLFVYEVPFNLAAGAYHWNRRGHAKSQRIAWNLSQMEVVMPKTVQFERPPGEIPRVWVAGFGSGTIARFEIDRGRPKVAGRFAVPPGTTDIVSAPKTLTANNAATEYGSLILTNSLLDRVYRLRIAKGDPGYDTVRGILPSESNLSWQSRIGELLFFTTLMTPQNRSEGELSRFTCETCHFEGGMDGRVHYTGRAHVYAATKPLFGLANNVPLFSRAGDRSVAAMVQAEFRVANQGRKDAFSLETDEHPWLAEIPDLPPLLSPRDLRMAFLSFFFDFRHRPNPWRSRAVKLSPAALTGLRVFRDRCEYCHQAVASTRDAQSLPIEEWQAWLEDEDRDLVWGGSFFSKTGIRPYVHRAGARVPSLRRVWQKIPYFTDGSSPTLRHLLSRFRYRELSVWHGTGGATDTGEAMEFQPLTNGEIDALEELLRHF